MNIKILRLTFDFATHMDSSKNVLWFLHTPRAELGKRNYRLITDFLQLQNKVGWTWLLDFIKFSLLLKTGSVRLCCSMSCAIKFWTSPRMDMPQLPWTSWSSVWHPYTGQSNFPLYWAQTPYVPSCACCLSSYCHVPLRRCLHFPYNSPFLIWWL